MSHILVVAGKRPDAAAHLFERGIAAFDRIALLQPNSRIQRCHVHAATFPSLAAADAGILQSGDDWACCAGTLFYHRESGTRALHEFLRATRGKNIDFARIDGSYAAVTQAGGEILVTTDRLGTLHIFETMCDACVLISTSSLILAALVRPEWDPTSCREFLATGTVFEDRTLFRGIRKLPPASVHVLRNGKVDLLSVYWDVKNYLFDRAENQGSVPALAESLKQAVTEITSAYPNALFDLTGGFDSRAIIAAALAAGISVSTVVNGPASDPDVRVANQIAKTFGLNHRHLERPQGAEVDEAARRALALCDGECDAFEYASTMLTHTMLAQKFDATVNGSNGEICKGYWWELLLPRVGAKSQFPAELVAARRFAVESGADLLDHTDGDLATHFAAVIRRANVGLEQYPNTAGMDNVYLTLRMQRWQGRIASATSRIWPCISPFMFRAPMEIALSTPSRVRVRHRMTRRLIEHLNPRLAAIPLAQGYPATPLRFRNAYRFTPILREFTHSAFNRLGIRIGSQKTAAPGVSFSVRQLRDLLTKGEMLTLDLYHRGRLDRVLESGNPRLANRVVTLEKVARAISGTFDGLSIETRESNPVRKL